MSSSSTDLRAFLTIGNSDFWLWYSSRKSESANLNGSTSPDYSRHGVKEVVSVD